MDAVVRSYCVDRYWNLDAGMHDWNYDRPREVAVYLADSDFVAQVDPAFFANPDRDRFVGEYVGRIVDGRPTVLMFYASLFELDATVGLSWMRRFPERPAFRDTLELPSHCTPPFGMHWPEKARILEGIDSAMVEALRTEVEFGDATYPAEVEIVVADFTPGSVNTYVLVLPGNKIYEVVIGEPLTFPKLTYEYKAGEATGYDPDFLSPKIERYGIVRTIRLPSS
jgi:hypothetical protein